MEGMCEPASNRRMIVLLVCRTMSLHPAQQCPAVALPGDHQPGGPGRRDRRACGRGGRG